MSDMIHPMGQISIESQTASGMGPSVEVAERDSVVRAIFTTNLIPSYPDQSMHTMLVDFARESYLVYGDVPNRDKYDQGAIVGISSSAIGTDRWEIVTLRMVPFEHEGRLGTEDSDMFHLQSPDGTCTSIIELLSQKGIQPSEVASMSRLAKQSIGSTRTLPASFAHLQVEMCKEARARGIKYLVSQQHHDLDRALSLGDLRFPFCDIAEYFGVDGVVVSNREDDSVWSTMSQYPGYFLSPDGIRETLVGRGVSGLPNRLKLKSVREVWQKYVADNSEMEMAMRDRNNVPDASFLSIAALDEWESAARAIINQYEKDQTK